MAKPASAKGRKNGNGGKWVKEWSRMIHRSNIIHRLRMKEKNMGD